MNSFKPNPNYNIEVFDNILSFDKIYLIKDFLDKAPYTYSIFDDSNLYPQAKAKLGNNFVINGKIQHKNWEWVFHIILESIKKIIDPVIIDKSLSNLQMQINTSNPLTSDNMHQDYPEEGHGYTILYYANSLWDINYGGETLFYDKHNLEIISTIKPKPGRFVIFDSGLFHSARPPQNQCPYDRYTIATKFLAI